MIIHYVLMIFPKYSNWDEETMTWNKTTASQAVSNNISAAYLLGDLWMMWLSNMFVLGFSYFQSRGPSGARTWSQNFRECLISKASILYRNAKKLSRGAGVGNMWTISAYVHAIKSINKSKIIYRWSDIGSGANKKIPPLLAVFFVSMLLFFLHIHLRLAFLFFQFLFNHKSQSSGDHRSNK